MLHNLIKKVIFMGGLFATAAFAQSPSLQQTIDVYGAQVKEAQASLINVCKSKYPQTKKELAAYITWLGQQPNAERQLQAFKIAYNWCIENHYIPKEVIQ